MNNKEIELSKIIDKNLENLPLVFFDLESKMKEMRVQSKLIKIQKYNTKIYPISLYNKHVTRFI